MGSRAIDVGWAGRTVAATEMLDGVDGSFRVIRGQCHTIVRVARRPQDLFECLQTIEREVARLDQAIEQTRRLLAGGRHHAEPGEVDLLAAVRDAMQRFSGAAAERGVALRLDADCRERMVVADGAAVGRLVDRLVEDAIVEAPSGTGVTFALTGCRTRSTLRVIDERGAAGTPTDVARVGALARRAAATLTTEPLTVGACVRIELPSRARVDLEAA